MLLLKMLYPVKHLLFQTMALSLLLSAPYVTSLNLLDYCKGELFVKISYNAIFEYTDDEINITFPDIPEAITCAYSKNEAIKMAKEALELTLHKRLLNHLPASTPKNKILKVHNSEVVEIIIEMNVKNTMLIGNNIIEYN